MEHSYFRLLYIVCWINEHHNILSKNKCLNFLDTKFWYWSIEELHLYFLFSLFLINYLKSLPLSQFLFFRHLTLSSSATPKKIVHCFDSSVFLKMYYVLQNSCNDAMIRSFQLAFSLRSISLEGGMPSFWSGAYFNPLPQFQEAFFFILN